MSRGYPYYFLWFSFKTGRGISGVFHAFIDLISCSLKPISITVTNTLNWLWFSSVKQPRWYSVRFLAFKPYVLETDLTALVKILRHSSYGSNQALKYILWPLGFFNLTLQLAHKKLETLRDSNTWNAGVTSHWPQGMGPILSFSWVLHFLDLVWDPEGLCLRRQQRIIGRASHEVADAQLPPHSCRDFCLEFYCVYSWFVLIYEHW